MSEFKTLQLLVVDDEPDLEFMLRQRFMDIIQDGKAEFYFAENGQDALEKLSVHRNIDIVLSDINMPVMDGLTFLSKLSKHYPLKKVIIVSAYGDMDNIRTAMNRGAFDFIVKPIDLNDLELTIQKTYDHVKQQKETLEAIRENDILKMYVDKDVISFMGGEEFEHSLLRSELQSATVMFIDICKYTSISEKYPPDQVTKLLNKYFDYMVTNIVNNDGHVDKFIGDAVMAIFKGKDHPTRALQTAITIRDSFQNIIEYDMDDYTPEIAIGVNSGDMIMGNIGSETLRRFDYTVIGDVVNTAQRFQSIAKPSQILTGKSTYQYIKNEFKCDKIGLVPLKNKAESSMVYNVINHAGYEQNA